MRTPTHEAALRYALEHGWHVFPVEPAQYGVQNSGKNPLTDVSLGLVNGKDNATTNPALIDLWWSRHPNANIGIALDKSGLVVLDVDVGLKKDGTPKQGRKSLEEFDAELPQTRVAITGGGGLHAVFNAAGAPIHALQLRDGLDLLGNAYIVAAPSVHWTGNVYRWNNNAPIAPVPDVLRRAVATRAEAKKVQPSEILERPPIGEGGRNIALFRLGASLRDSGIGAQALAAALHWENQQRCNPPLPDYELRLIVDSVLKRVQPSRDVAAGAVAAQEVLAAVAPPSRSVWVYEQARRKEPPMRFYPTGFPDLDAKIGGGLATRQVFGVVAPPSVGKSAFGGTLAMNLAPMLPMLLTSTELPRHELMIRFAAARLGLPWREGMKGLFADDQLAQALDGLRIRIIGCDDLDRLNPLQCIELEAQKMAEETGMMPGVIVDYIQMLARTSEDKMRSRVGELTMGLRIMSQVLDTIMVAVFATKRDFYGNGDLTKLRETDDPLMFLSAAKESGDIEFDCATLVYLDVDQQHEGQPKPARIAISRCRVGDTGFVGVQARLDTGLWYPDPDALAQLTKDKRNDRKNLAQAEKDDLRLIEIIQRMPGRSWRDLRLAARMGGARADAARARLLETGRLYLAREAYYDNLQRRQNREVLRVVEGGTIPEPGNFVPPLSVAGEEDV